MRVALRFVLVWLATALSWPVVVSAQPASNAPPDAPELAPIDAPEEAATKPTGPRRPKPGGSLEDLYRIRPSASEEKLQATIESLYQIIDWAEDEDPEKPSYYARLADLYWQKAEAYFMVAFGDEMEMELVAAREAGDEAKLADIEARRRQLLQYGDEWRRKAVRIFQEIEQKYPNYEKIDGILFYLGNFMSQMGESEEGFEYYKKLVTRYPDSDRLGDAMLNIGEYFFGKDDFETAAEFYLRVKEFKKSRIYPFALYKLAWCYYNMANYEGAFLNFVEVIQHTMEQERTGKVTIGLKAEAQRDIVYAYSQLGKQAKALEFFREIAGEIYIELGETLAELYLVQGENLVSIAMYQSLAAERPESTQRLLYQVRVVMAADALAVKDRIRAELTRLVDMYQEFQVKHPEVVAREAEETEAILRKMAYAYHSEAQKTADKGARLLAAELYGHYLTLFPQGQGRYEMLWNQAVLLYQSGKFELAVVEFERVVDEQPAGKYAKKAAFYAVYSYYQLIDTRKVTEVKTQEDDELDKVELPPLQASMVRACDRFVAMGSDDPEQLVQAKFAAARTLYDHNHFDEASRRFAEFIEAHGTHETAKDAAILLLSSLNMARNIRALNEWADRLYVTPGFAEGRLLVLIQKIRDEAKFNRCFEFEFEKRYEAAADCFVDYTRNFPQSKILDKALYNAALNYQNARKYVKALETNAALYRCCSKTSRLGPRSLYLIADTYRMAAVYGQAAQYYEDYVRRHPKEQKVKAALMYASSFRRGLGQYDLASKNYDTYIRLFPKDPKVPAIVFDQGIMLASQKQWKKVVSHFTAYLKRFGQTGGINQELAARQQIGDAYLADRQAAKARKEFDTVIEMFQKLTPEELKTIDARGVSAIAWAYFNLGDLTAQEGASLKLTRRTLKEDTDRKLAVIQKAEEQFLIVHSMDHPYWSTAALYRIGALWERFADDLENSPVPPGLSGLEAEDYKMELFQAAEEIRNRRVVKAFTMCLDVGTAHRIFNEFTEKAQQTLAQISMQSGGFKEYRIRPEYLNGGTNPPAFRTRRVLMEPVKSRGPEARDDGLMKPGDLPLAVRGGEAR